MSNGFCIFTNLLLLVNYLFLLYQFLCWFLILNDCSSSICWCRDPILYPKTPTSMSTYHLGTKVEIIIILFIKNVHLKLYLKRPSFLQRSTFLLFKKQLSILNRKMESIMEMVMMKKMEQQSHQVVRRPQRRSQAIWKEKVKQPKNVTGKDAPLLMEQKQRHQKLHQEMSIQSMVRVFPSLSNFENI